MSHIAPLQRTPPARARAPRQKTAHVARPGVTAERATPTPAVAPHPFDAAAFLNLSDVPQTLLTPEAGDTIFAQGERALHVLYIRSGAVKLSVLSKSGKEAVVAMLGPGDFFGEGCLAGQPLRLGAATATTACVLLRIRGEEMAKLLHREHTFSDRFISHMLARNIRTEEDLIDQLFNSSEKRLARALLLLAHYGTQDSPIRVVPAIPQATLAEMIGTTRSRVNFFMNKFRKQGFIEYADDTPITINSSLLAVVLRD